MPQRTLRPPFRIERCVALAYVAGRYQPPGPKLGPAGFLGIYVAKTDPRLSFWTFDRKGRRLAFSLVTREELNVEYTLIRGWLTYEVPFGQWRMYDVGKSEAAELHRLKLRDDYNEARKRLGAVLYQARTGAYFRSPKLKPMFALRPRSDAAMRKDAAEFEVIMDSVRTRGRGRF
jgi:hypothetical protein